MTVRRPLEPVLRTGSLKPHRRHFVPGKCITPRSLSEYFPRPKRPGLMPALLRCPRTWQVMPQSLGMNSAGWGLAILSFINLFNYLDRFLVPALFESLKHSELRLTDAQLGSLMSGFLAVYTLAAPCSALWATVVPGPD